MTRSGTDYINGLRDGRQVYIDGELVSDVTTHPGFTGVIGTIAELYDFTNDEANRADMTYPSPITGEPVSLSYLIPRSSEDLKRRRIALRKSTERSFGLVGRGPEHVASFLAGWAARSDIFARSGQRYADNITAFYEYARDNDLFCTYAIVPPQIDRSKPAHQQEDRYLYAGVKEEREDGIVISGAQMLATGAVVADYIILSCIVPLVEGDEDYAISVAVPLSAPGLRVLSRRSYASAATSVFDYPLASQFDETDSLVVFDDVFVPWKHVFVYRDRKLVADQWNETPAHLLGNNQAQIRFTAKLDFLVGLASKVTKMNRSDKAPPVKGALGELAAYASLIHGQVYAQENNVEIDERGVAWPARAESFAVMVIQSELYPKMLHMVRDLAGGGIIQLPSSVEDFQNPQSRADLDRYVQSPGVSSVERVKLLKLMWDLTGSEFASRHEQYEMFYAGAPFLVKMRMFQVYDFKRGEDLVDRALAGYDENGLVPARKLALHDLQ
ncbi:4-hydroxyphenylacetate 3-hydroxylase N-terminal domain-containing protein [Saxibacter everestensis]|uniref:4-hydroxyphenylacetate 3-hydroxylase N-terminal domain-containing protein n=1 Tax=Saxibacter everestensis TaxID=2909229 RepID=A0ABY8QRR4_9MICO|nr:4-hydroxyphenylacetate 3-hydroxylase N-terminal domain-containing protein [Brevibacteriaceae bacterium ZFBP1038]